MSAVAIVDYSGADVYYNKYVPLSLLSIAIICELTEDFLLG